MGIKEEYRKLLLIDYSRLDDMLSTQASRHSWICEQSAEADRALRDAIQKTAVTEAIAFKRLKATTDNGKPLTDTYANRILPAEDDVVKARSEASNKQFDAKILSGAVTSFQQRKTMLAKIAEREVMVFYGDPKRQGKKQSIGSALQGALDDEFRGRPNESFPEEHGGTF